MARLVEILADEMQEWPEDPEYKEILSITQDPDMSAVTWEYRNPVFKHDTWGHPEDIPVDGCELHALATDHATAIVTREQWQAERRRIEAGVKSDIGSPADPVKNFRCTVVPVSFEPCWDSAPVWADRFGMAGPASAAVWFNDEKYSYMGEETEYLFEDSGCRGMSDIYHTTPRPTNQQWTGEGLPPVGAPVMFESNQCGVIGYHDGLVVCAMDDDYENGCYDGFSARDLKPIRTPREKWIEAAIASLNMDYSVQRETGTTTQEYVENAVVQVYDTMIAKLPEDGE